MDMMQYMNLIIQKIEEKIPLAGYENEEQFLDMIQENPKAEIGYLMGQRSIISLIAQIAPILLQLSVMGKPEEGEEE